MKRLFNYLLLVLVVALSCSCVKIKQQPVDATAALGEPVTFTVTATGIGALKYQWERSDNGGLNWSQIPGATSANYTINSVSVADLNASFRCNIKDALNASKTYTVELTVALEKGVTHFAGPLGGMGKADGTGSQARFRYPFGITKVGAILYVADTYNNSVRKVVIGTGEVTTIAGFSWVPGSTDGTGSAARFHNPYGITSDGTSLYVTDKGNHTIRKIVIATGVVSTLAGSAGNSGSLDGIGAAARFNKPSGITTDGTNLFVTDTANQTIRKIIIATGEVSTVAGSAGVSGSLDGIGAAARFNKPLGIATNGTNLYVADRINFTIRKIVIATGEVTTFAGLAGVYGDTNGIGTNARFYGPFGLTTDGTNLFVTEDYDYPIRKIVLATAEVTALTEIPSSVYRAGITTDGTSLYISMQAVIQKIVIATAEVSTLAGFMEADFAGDADGIGSAARFKLPSYMATDGSSLYVADSQNNTIRKVVISTGEVSTFAGTAGISGSSDGIGSSAGFDNPNGITTDGTNLYVTDTYNQTIRKIAIATRQVTTIAGSVGQSGSTDGTGSAARFNYPFAITNDGTNLYVADTYSNTIRKIVIATDAVTTFAGQAGPSGSSDGIGTAARFYYPFAITCSGSYLYVADSGNHTIRKINIATSEVTTIAGQAGSIGSADGTGSAARFYQPEGITTDGTSLFVSDSSNNMIRSIDIATRAVTTITGTPPYDTPDYQENYFYYYFGSDDGTLSAASFAFPVGIVCGGQDILYVVDSWNCAIRMIVK